LFPEDKGLPALLDEHLQVLAIFFLDEKTMIDAVIEMSIEIFQGYVLRFCLLVGLVLFLLWMAAVL
jgi:hypothetical protein